MSIDNKQWTIITFGLLSFGTLAYYYKKYSEKKQYFQQKKEQFLQVYDICKRNELRPDFQYSKKNKHQQSTSSQKLACFFYIIPKYNASTFRLYQRQRSLLQDSSSFKHQLLENQMGGDFSFQYKNQKIRCKLNDFHVSTTLFQEHKKNVQIFKDYDNKIQPIVCEVMTTLKPSMLVSIFGKIYFDQNRLEWALEPIFLTEGRQFKGLICDFYDKKIVDKLLVKLAIIVGGLVLTYFTIFKPISSLIRKYQERKKEKVFYNQIQYFKNKDYLVVKGSSLLNCQQCKIKHVQIAYDCGHLVLCLACHQQNIMKLCPLCKKQSKKFLRVFMA